MTQRPSDRPLSGIAALGVLGWVVGVIAAALAPSRKQFNPTALDLLEKSLAIVVGTEAMVVLKDVLQLDNAEATKVRRWAIRASGSAAAI